jgi:hypothetical protein
MTRNRSRLLVLFTLLALAACTNAATTEAPTTPLPFATNRPTRTPSPTVAPTETPVPGGLLLTMPGVACCRGQVLEAGVYELPLWLGVPLTLEISSGWRAVNDQAANFLMLGRGENALGNPDQMIIPINAAGPGSPEAALDAVRSAPELTALAEPAAVTVAGFEGWQWDAAARSNPTYAGNEAADIPPQVQFLPVMQPFFTPGFSFTTSSPEARVRLIALAVEAHTLLLYLEAPPDEFDAFMLEAHLLLQSLELIEE